VREYVNVCILLMHVYISDNVYRYYENDAWIWFILEPVTLETKC